MKCDHCRKECDHELVEIASADGKPGPKAWLCPCKRTLKLEQEDQ